MSFSPLQVQELVARHKGLAMAIARGFPEADEESLLDTLEGASDLQTVLATVVRSRVADLLFVEALQRRLEAMRGRLRRLESRAEQKRVLVCTAMQEAGLRKLVEPDFTAYLRPSLAKVIVIDETLIPEEFWVPQPARLDRQQLLVALKGGRAVPGAELANPEPVLAIRSV